MHNCGKIGGRYRWNARKSKKKGKKYSNALDEIGKEVHNSAELSPHGGIFVGERKPLRLTEDMSVIFVDF